MGLIGAAEESLGEVKDEKLREDGTLLNAAKDAVLSLLEQPLNLLGVNGFRKPEGEGDSVTEDEDMSQRTSKSEEGMNSSDQGVPKQNMEEDREKTLSEEEPSSPTSLPEVKANVSESENKSVEQPSTPPEEPQGDRNTQTTDSNLYLGPRDPHLLSEQHKEYSINSETEENVSNKSSPQNSDLVDRYGANDTTTQEGDFTVGKTERESPSGGSDSGQQFQNDLEESGEERREESTANGSDSDLKTQQQATEGVSTPELSLVEETPVLEDGDETGAGDGEEGLGLDVGLRNKAVEKEEDDDTGCKETAKERMEVLREAIPALGPEGDREEEILSQNNQPLGPTSSEMGEESVVMGTEPSEPQDTLMAGGVQNGATATVHACTNGRLSQEISEEDNGVEKRDITGSIDKHSSTNVPLMNTSQAENAGSNDSNGTEDQLGVTNLDDNGDRLEANTSLNDTADGITFNDSLHSQSAGSEPGNVSLTPHNASCGGTNGVGLPQPREKSVFVRLSNRIRDLEVNMSLFSSYLDQLSSSLKRNKNKTEDTQKSLDKRILALNESLQLLRQETEIGLAGLRRVSTDLHQVATAVQEMAAGLHSTREEITSQFLLVSVIQVSVVTFVLLAVCLWLTCKQQALRNELQTLQITVARIPTQDYVNHVEKNHTHERCGYIPRLQSSNHIQPSNHLRPSNHIWRTECLWSNNSHGSCDERRRKLPSQSSLDDGDWEAEPWHLVTKAHKKKAKLNKSNSS